MSTRSTIKYGDGFHLYSDLMGDAIHLELKGVEFKASRDSVDVAIPLAVWEIIRNFTLPDAALDLVDLSDDDLKAKVEAEVDERIAQEDDAGLMIFGPRTLSREEQVARGLEWYREKREGQRMLQMSIQQLGHK